MPFTPFHFGPALLFGVPLRRRLDFVTFLIANVIVDSRATLVFFDVLSGRIHGPLHTYLGATLLAGVLAGGVIVCARWRPAVMDRISSRPGSVGAVLLASVTGTWLHVTLDSILYTDIQPFAPLSINPLYGTTSMLSIYAGCVFALGLGVVASLPTLHNWLNETN
ncbi:hypothetical protein [Halocatena pleomorpha]|uniref:Metal-dependent hydrolase n=1 Tax=Halocatena pleomorpha TaxID=1785090 RepID=A0A3P3RHT7_9EURY|nr:hypothetical protein [Halocatena pleomorpha]RRJ32972.1 hypothetical protein EIK79_03840 [Halocatena pleomorpha]